jgi:hypothetical protein
MAYQAIITVDYGDGKVMGYARETDYRGLSHDDAVSWASMLCETAAQELRRRRPDLNATFSFRLENW